MVRVRTLTEHEEAVLQSLLAVARPLILDEFSADSCIASTRIAIDVLDYFGIKADRMPISIAVFNQEAVTELASGTTMVNLHNKMATISVEEPGGPWSVGVGSGAGTGWAGHLVATIPDAGILIDLSIDQGNRPHKGLDLGPYAAIIEDPDWWADPTKTYAYQTPDEVVLIFDRRVPDPTGYLRSLNWKRRSSHHEPAIFKTVTGNIIRAVRAHLSDPEHTTR